MSNFLNNIFTNFKTPHFWEKDGILPQLLIPLTLVYFIAKRLVEKKVIKPKKFKANIITVGNPIAGGAGKTPVAIALYELLSKELKGEKICFVSKGYGGTLKGPLVVDAKSHTAKQVGDEPILLASHASVIVSKDRLKGIEFAEEKGFDLIITDDGLHDDRFEKIMNIAVIDGAYGLGNRLVIPSGPLRDRIDIALQNVNHLLLVGEDQRGTIDYIKMRTKRDDFTIFNSSIAVKSKHKKDNVYVAFAAIGRPKKFFDTLVGEGFFLSDTVEFPDHKNYTDEDMEYLENMANEQKAILITTEKDFIKLPEDFKKKVECLKIKQKFKDEKAIIKHIKQAIQSHS